MRTELLWTDVSGSNQARHSLEIPALFSAPEEKSATPNVVEPHQASLLELVLTSGRLSGELIPRLKKVANRLGMPLRNLEAAIYSWKEQAGNLEQADINVAECEGLLRDEIINRLRAAVPLFQFLDNLDIPFVATRHLALLLEVFRNARLDAAKILGDQTDLLDFDFFIPAGTSKTIYEALLQWMKEDLCPIRSMQFSQESEDVEQAFTSAGLITLTLSDGNGGIFQIELMEPLYVKTSQIRDSEVDSNRLLFASGINRTGEPLGEDTLCRVPEGFLPDELVETLSSFRYAIGLDFYNSYFFQTRYLDKLLSKWHADYSGIFSGIDHFWEWMFDSKACVKREKAYYRALLVAVLLFLSDDFVEEKVTLHQVIM